MLPTAKTMDDSTDTPPTAWLDFRPAAEGGSAHLIVGGPWLIASAAELDAELIELPEPHSSLRVEFGDLTHLDTAGAWLLHRTMLRWRERSLTVELDRLRPEFGALLEEVERSYRLCAVVPPRGNSLLQAVERLGRGTADALTTGRDFLAFFGSAILTFARTVVRPRRLRLTSTVHHMEEAGFDALPIVGLISLLIGIVLAYQGAVQLRQFGAQVFVADLVSIAVLRELGIVLTAIVVAGRSGSAFTAQLGSMKVREEIDALKTLGLDPMEVLVLPRMLALVITLPLLTFFADMCGLLGGGLMSWVALDVPPVQFLDRMRAAVGVSNFWVGIGKAPVFAMLIALVGCFEGFAVRGSAESVGHHTTRSVVESIFLVIVVDALFSIFFDLVGV